MRNNYKLIFLIFLILISCSERDIIFLDIKEIDGVWNKDNKIDFSFNSEELAVDISLIFRTDYSYPFSNIFLITSVENNNLFIIDTINHSFKKKSRSWYDIEKASINSSKILIKKSFKIKNGLTKFTVKHSIRHLDSIMPLTKLGGILDIGLIVEKSLK